MPADDAWQGGGEAGLTDANHLRCWGHLPQAPTLGALRAGLSKPAALPAARPAGPPALWGARHLVRLLKASQPLFKRQPGVLEAAFAPRLQAPPGDEDAPARLGKQA